MTLNTVRAAIGSATAIAFAVFLSGGSLPATADDRPQPLQRSAAEWVERLDASSFSARREATRRLEELGLDAIEALAEGARSPEPEVAQRCFDILTRHFESGTANVSEAAKTQLEALAADANPTTAGRAQNVLTPKPKPGPMRPSQPNVQQIRQRIAIRVANGKRTIEVERNGKKIIIRVEGDKHIVERPGLVPPKPPAEYKDEQALEKADPEAHGLLKQFGAGRIKIMRRGGPGQPLQPGQPIRPGQLQIQLRNLFGKPQPPAPAPPQENAPEEKAPAIDADLPLPPA